jgi:hypothetical protein
MRRVLRDELSNGVKVICRYEASTLLQPSRHPLLDFAVIGQLTGIRFP